MSELKSARCQIVTILTHPRLAIGILVAVKLLIAGIARLMFGGTQPHRARGRLTGVEKS